MMQTNRVFMHVGVGTTRDGPDLHGLHANLTCDSLHANFFVLWFVFVELEEVIVQGFSRARVLYTRL